MPIFNSVYKSFSPTFTYEYNFVGKTTNQMETDGWTFYQNKNLATFNSNGINITTQDNGINAAVLDITTIMPLAKKVTISSTANFNGRLRNHVFLYDTRNNSFTGTTGVTASGAENNIGVYVDDARIKTNMTISGSITETMIIDLENGAWTASGTNGYSSNGTLTSSEISNIRNNSKGICLGGISWGGGGSSSGGLTSISLKIKY